MVYFSIKNKTFEWKREVFIFNSLWSDQKFPIYRPYVTTMNIQIVILQNQHSGKDTHIRQVKIFGPRE